MRHSSSRESKLDPRTRSVQTVPFRRHWNKNFKLKCFTFHLQNCLSQIILWKIAGSRRQAGRAVASGQDKRWGVDFWHGQPLDRSSHGSGWDDSSTLLLCPCKNRRENKHWRHILLQIFSGQKVGCYIIKLECIFYGSRVTMWSSDWRENIHVFKGKGAHGHCSSLEVLEINHKGPQEKSALWELQRRCPGRGGSQAAPTHCIVQFCFTPSNFTLLTGLNFARQLSRGHLSDRTLTASVWTRDHLNSCCRRPSVRIFLGGKSPLLPRVMNMSRGSYPRHHGIAQLLLNP